MTAWVLLWGCKVISDLMLPYAPIQHPSQADAYRELMPNPIELPLTPRGSISNSPPPAEPPGAGKICSINVADWNLAKVIQELSTQTKTNLILLSKPDTKLTIRLTNLKLGEMLKHIAAVTGLAVLRVGETYVLAGETELAKAYPKEWTAEHPIAASPSAPVMVMETYMTRYVDSTQISDALEKIFGKSELLVLAGPASSTPSMRQQNTSGIVGSGAGVLEKKGEDLKQAGRMLVLKGPPDIVASAMALAKQMDYARPQWQISVTVHDISNNALKDLGLSWSFSNVSITEKNVNGLGLGSFSRAPMSFVATLMALETQDKAKLLASPTISALDGERAFILIGDKLSFPNLVGYSQAGTPIFEAKEIQVGIYLQVSGAVSDEKSITLSLYPQVSAVKGFKSINGALYPDISTREAQTTIRATSGETIVLAGMLRDEEISHLDKVPLLGDIPFLGALFRHRSKTKVSSQVIITLTPTIIPAK